MAMEIGGEGSLPPALDNEEGVQLSNVNISDVFDAIQVADPSFQTVVGALPPTDAEMFGGGVHAAPAPSDGRPYVKIVEQPASKALRFRYECEGRSAGSIPGVNSTSENKTYPTIEIVGYRGRAVVVVSCVTKDKPYRPHPHNLVGKELCKKGVCTVEVNSESMTVAFSNLGIQCVKKRDIEDALKVREEMRVDPFKTGFGHRNQPSSIDLNAVRLCFQVFVEQGGRIRHSLQPVVSEVIYDKKAMSDLVICRLSHCSAPVAGGQQVILLCEKVTKEDITVNFFESLDNVVQWQADADSVNVHKQVAIVFQTPAYRNIHVDSHVKVFIQLKRPSDGATSDPLPFEFTPMSADPFHMKRKRQKPLSDLSPYLQPELERPQAMPSYMDFIQREQKPIKLEPRDKSPQHGMVMPGSPSNMGMYRNIAASPSPQHLVPTPSPPLHHYTPLEPHYMWNIQGGDGVPNLAVPGTSHMAPAYNVAPQHVQTQHAPPQHAPPQHAAPQHAQTQHAQTQHAQPQLTQMNMAWSDAHLHNLHQTQGQQQTNLVESTQHSDAPNISGLLAMDANYGPFNSAELSGLSNFLDPEHVTDSFGKLTTGDFTDRNAL